MNLDQRGEHTSVVWEDELRYNTLKLHEVIAVPHEMRRYEARRIKGGDELYKATEIAYHDDKINDVQGGRIEV
jgi:hypothetical protein